MSRVLCSIPTKQRYDALMHCLQSVAFQTRPPDKVVIYDDTEEAKRIDVREHTVGRYLLPLLTARGIEWEVTFTPGRGQHIAHQMANCSGYDYVWRIDDDEVAEPDVLERLLAHMEKPGVGAVGGAVYEVRNPTPGGSNRIEDLFDKPNVQWAPDQGVHVVEHLYSSFLYRAGVVDYKHDMSPVAFREETIFTHRLHRAGYTLIADTGIHAHHFRCAHGGIRSSDNEWAFAWDHAEFMRLMEREWRVKLIHMGAGLGDCLAFKNLLPELRERYDTILIGSCYDEVFEGEPNVRLIDYGAARQNSQDNVYEWAAERKWRGSLIDAMRKVYLP